VLVDSQGIALPSGSEGCELRPEPGQHELVCCRERAVPDGSNGRIPAGLENLAKFAYQSWIFESGIGIAIPFKAHVTLAAEERLAAVFPVRLELVGRRVGPMLKIRLGDEMVSAHIPALRQ